MPFEIVQYLSSSVYVKKEHSIKKIVGVLNVLVRFHTNFTISVAVKEQNTDPTRD